MKLSTAVFAAACAALESVTSSAVDGATCSSLNGPFCAGLGSGFRSPPLHAKQDVILDEEAVKLAEMVKNSKIEDASKQEAMPAVASDADDSETRELMLQLMAMLENLLDSEDTSPSADKRESSSAIDAFELESMNGDELKECFESALDEVLFSGNGPLQVSSDVRDAVRTTARQLKALKDYSTYTFQRLTKSQLASIRNKFAKQRVTELQQAFEQLLLVDNSWDRQLALETAIFLFQLAQEDAASKKSKVKENWSGRH